MVQIETLIFVDFETTGLPSDNATDPLLNTNKLPETARERTIRLQRIIDSDGTNWKGPRVTEMSFLCIPRSLFVDGANRMQTNQFVDPESGQERFEHVPIAGNVHTRQLDPVLSALEWTEYELLQRITPAMRLKKSELVCKNTFATEWPGVQHLLETARKPACMIAHNGITFDFRLLWHEMHRAGLVVGQQALPDAGGNNGTGAGGGRKCCPIPEQIFFLDSLHSLLDIESDYNREMEIVTQNVDWQSVFSNQQQNEMAITTTTASITASATTNSCVANAIFSSSTSFSSSHFLLQPNRNEQLLPAWGGGAADGTNRTEEESDGIGTQQSLKEPQQQKQGNCLLNNNNNRMTTMVTTTTAEEFIDEDEGDHQELLALRAPLNAGLGMPPSTPERTGGAAAHPPLMVGKQQQNAAAATANKNGSTAKRALDFGCANGGAGANKFPGRRQQPHPIAYMRTSKWSPAKRSRIDGRFFECSNAGEWAFNGHQARAALMARGTFRLETMHNRLFFSTSTPSSSFNAHRAEADCEALLQCCLTYGTDFLTHMDRNCSPLPDCFRTTTSAAGGRGEEKTPNK